MKATDFIRQTLESSRQWALGLITDMQDSPLTQPTPNGGNHPLWVLGHLVYSESTLLDSFILGQANRFADWEKVFGMGSQPTTNTADYPSMEEVLPKWDEVRNAALAHLETLSDDDLGNSTHAPEEFGEGFSTVAGCYAAMCTHSAFHAGQVADARRAAGRDPLMA